MQLRSPIRNLVSTIFRKKEEILLSCFQGYDAIKKMVSVRQSRSEEIDLLAFSFVGRAAPRGIFRTAKILCRPEMQE